jgi:hypothetical protein
MKTYSLIRKEDGYCFEDQNKAVNEIFYSKERAIAILIDLLIGRDISLNNTLSLIDEVSALGDLPAVDRQLVVIDWLVEDTEALYHIQCVRDSLTLAKESWDLSEPKIILCPHCESHAYIIGLHVFEMFFSKEEGRDLVDFLRDDEIIDLADGLKLTKRLDQIVLPETVPRVHNPTREN